MFNEWNTLLFRGDKEDRLSFILQLLQGVADFLQFLLCLRQIKNMDATADAIQILFHLRVPLFFAVTKVAGIGDQFFFGGDRHRRMKEGDCLLVCLFARRASKPANEEPANKMQQEW